MGFDWRRIELDTARRWTTVAEEPFVLEAEPEPGRDRLPVTPDGEGTVTDVEVGLPVGV